MSSKRTSSRGSATSATAARAARPRSRRRTTRSPASTPPSRGTSTPEPRFALVGGKGGVGKTTCAAALAVDAVRAGRRALLISTDPASSLADAFQLRPSRGGSAAPRRVPIGARTLHLLEIDSTFALERWLETRRPLLQRIALRGTILDEEDVAALLRLSLPGIDELVALLEIARLGADARFDTVIVDTAPTGHTLRMLTLPDTLRAVARVFDRMQDKHRTVVEALRGAWTPDAEDALIDELDRDGQQLGELLRDPLRVAMWWVTLPEPMAVEETSDALGALAVARMPLSRVVVNKVTPPPPRRCRWCEARRAFEARAIRMMERAAPGIELVEVLARDREPRGAAAFAAIGKQLRAAATEGASRRGTEQPEAFTVALDNPAAIPSLAEPSTRLLLFGGKGGTGKTTCAAAMALALAKQEPGRRILLLSTDPAHSLSDVLGSAVGDEPRRVRAGPSNLHARELDAGKGFADLRDRYAAAIDALFDRMSRGSVDASADRLVLHGLIDLAPPGVDELAAVIEVTDALDAAGRGAYDLIVMDTAPTGHALRLLETPALVQDWTRTLMSILLKYQSVVGVGEMGAMLLRLSKGLGRLRALLENRERCRFVAVTRAAALPRAETVRLLARLRAMDIHVPAVVVNAVGRGTCARCRAVASAERREVTALARDLKGGSRPFLVLAPSQVPPPQAPADLLRWGKAWTRVGGVR